MVVPPPSQHHRHTIYMSSINRVTFIIPKSWIPPSPSPQSPRTHTGGTPFIKHIGNDGGSTSLPTSSSHYIHEQHQQSHIHHPQVMDPTVAIATVAPYSYRRYTIHQAHRQRWWFHLPPNIIVTLYTSAASTESHSSSPSHGSH